MMMILPTMMSILLYSRDTLSRLFLFFLFFLNTILVYEEEGKISMVRIGGRGGGVGTILLEEISFERGEILLDNSATYTSYFCLIHCSK